MGCSNQKMVKQEEAVIKQQPRKDPSAETTVQKSEENPNEKPNGPNKEIEKEEKQEQKQAEPVKDTATTKTPAADEKQQSSTEDAEQSNQDPSKKKLTQEQKEEFQKYLETQKKLVDDLMAQISSLMVKSQVSTEAIFGNIDFVCPTDAKIVRIFTSSTFTDTKQERNYLMKHAYPKIKTYCRKIGYEFQVVDMRWGVRDEAADDHMTTELCLKELKLCQEVSTGPNFVTLLSHKYGYTPFPRTIEATEFESLMVSVEDEQTLALFKKWYTRDDNAIPAEYVLSPISKHLPAFIGAHKEEKQAAKETWWTESDTMQQALEQSATTVFGEQHARKFIMSVTETELKEGLLDIKDPSEHCLWLKRDIIDLKGQPKDYALSRFKECLGPEEKIAKAQSLLNDLKENRMAKVLKREKILQYNVCWSPEGGINPDASDEHKKYLAKMSDDFTEAMINMISKAVKEKSRNNDHIVDECIQHIKFCQLKCKNFHGRGETLEWCQLTSLNLHGREEILEQIKQYVTSKTQKKPPLVVHGQSGSGKTSILAMVAKLVPQWTSSKPLIILRFLGTTQDSSSLMALLYSMTSQIEKCLRLPVSPPTENIQVQRAKFWLAVHKYQAKKPLVIILDSLDQLDDANDARKLLWMPAALAKGTIILSTLEEPQYQCFPALQQIITEPSNFISVPTLSRESCNQILSSWFEMHKRQVTTKQMDLLLNAFDHCSTPLFLKLSFDEAVRWTSYIAEDEMVLCDTVRASIDHLFQRLEKLHGKVLVSRALGYLTIARNGASEVELEDILSCDDDVLNDVYMYWTPPTRRLPPLLLVRIRSDLSQYLVERGADGVRVLYWYHRQFIEAAEARYCMDPNTVEIIHKNLADFFGGAWADGKKKPFINSDGESAEEDRFVSTQPLAFGSNQYNYRKLNNLPFHCIKGGNLEMLLENCLSNIDFLVTKMKAFDIMLVLDDFKMANQTFPDEALISAILSAMQLSQKGLKMDPAQIVPQMLQRLTVTKETSEFLQKCREYPNPYLEPNKQLLDLPGGQLIHTIATHKGDIDMIDMSTDGKLVLTVCQEKKEVFLWSIEEAKQVRALQSPGQCTEAYFCMNNSWVALEMEKFVKVEDVHTGSKKMAIPMFKSSWCVAGENRKILVVAKNKSCNIYDLDNNGEVLGTATLGEKEKGFGQLSTKAGSAHYVAITDGDQYRISVLDLQSKSFHKQFRGFPKVKTEDGDWDEHEVEAICFTHDESCLVYTNMFTSEVLFTDLNGTVLRSIPGNDERNYTSLALSPDGSQLFLVDRSMVHIYSTTTLQEIDEIEHVKDVKTVRIFNDKCIVTISDDSNLRIWDRTREKLKQLDKTTFLKHTYISSAMLLDNPRYILMSGRIQKDDKPFTIIVYDIFKEEAVKEITIMTTDNSQASVKKIYKTNVWNKVVMVMERKMHVLDLDTMSIVMTTDGYLDRYFKSVHQNRILYSTNNDIVCLTKGSMHLKLYDQTTGKVNKVIKAGQEKKLDEITVSKSGKVACARTDDEILLLFDLVKCEYLYTICDKVKYKDSGYQMLINAGGTILLFSISAPLPDMQQKDEVDHIVVWDIANNKEIGRMCDIEYEKKNLLKGTAESKGQTAVYELFELDADRVLTLGLDDIIRVHDINTGKLLHRLEGHFSTPQIHFEVQSPYLLTFANLDEEGSLRLWDKQTYQCLASFTLEKDVDQISMSPDGNFFTSIMSDNLLVQWRIHHSPHNSILNEADYPHAFSSKVQGEDFMYSKTESPLQHLDPDDVDSDPDVYSGDEDEDDDEEEEEDKDDDDDDDDDDD